MIKKYNSASKDFKIYSYSILKIYQIIEKSSASDINYAIYYE